MAPLGELLSLRVVVETNAELQTFQAIITVVGMGRGKIDTP